jgi:uncharacterized RDD family membrane protein YckC
MASDASPTSSHVASAAKPDALTRFLAFLIDAVAAGVIGLVPIIGGLAGAAYILFRDGFDVDFMRHRSLGKKLMKLDVVRLDGAPMDLTTSARRNWPLAFGSLTQALLFIPVIGWALIPIVALVGLGLVIVEILKVLSSTDGRRLGDDVAATRVVMADA